MYVRGLRFEGEHPSSKTSANLLIFKGVPEALVRISNPFDTELSASLKIQIGPEVPLLLSR